MYTNRKTIIISLLLIVLLLAGIPGSFARPQYFQSLTALYGDGSCGTCHFKTSGGGPRNSYGTLFENQADHAADPGAALTAIGPPPTTSPTLTPTSTVTPAAAGFGIVVSLVGLFVSALLVRRNNK